MTISVLQTAPASAFSNTVTFSSGVTLGNYLVITGSALSTGTPPSSGGPPTVGGVTPAGTVQLNQEQSPGATLTVYASAWMLPVTAAIAGGTVVVFPSTGSTGAVGVVAWETAGWTGTPTADQSSVNQGTTTAITSGTTGAITQAPELIAGWATAYGVGQGTGPAGYTNTDGTAGSGYFFAGYQVVSSAGGTYAYADTAVGSANWAAGITTLYSAGTAAVNIPPFFAPMRLS